MSLDSPNLIKDPTPEDILRYRYHHGTNLGSIYVLERWLHPSLFHDDTQGSSELEAVKGWVEKIGMEATKRKFEEHWRNAVTDADIEWLRDRAKCTTIRLPVGYFSLSHPSLTENTPFSPYHHIYAAAWSSIRTLISRLRAHSIGTLLDLHALPGGANKADHSGTNTGVARLWTSSPNRDLGVRCCQFLAQEVKGGLAGVVGIQVANEADWESEGMWEWYDDCIAAISEVDASIPVVISDGWNLGQAIEYSLKKNVAYPDRPTCPIIIDTHHYWTFSDADKQKSPEEIIQDVDTKLHELDSKEGDVITRGAVQVLIGEYSSVMSEETWSKAASRSRSQLTQTFAHRQTHLHTTRTAGSFFWTLNMDWPPGGSWGFRDQTDCGNIVPPHYSSIPDHEIGTLLQRAQHRRDERMYKAVTEHVQYWTHLTPNSGAEHWRYEFGWKVGFGDAYIFFEGRGRQAVRPGNRIGALELWVLKRIRECGFRGRFVWEFEQGVRRGVGDFGAVVGWF